MIYPPYLGTKIMIIAECSKGSPKNMDEKIESLGLMEGEVVTGDMRETIGRGHRTIGRDRALEQGREQADEGFPEAVEEGAADERRDGFDGETRLLVGEEDVFHTEGHGSVIEEDVGLEVVFEAAEVYIGGATGGETVVAHEDFGVVEACLV